ncbi:alpha/beta hydrolase [Lactiplantibacillus plantarum]|uniref:alpha/beta hydrolase n=1 Tax=Lactiplantibacillus plantarum TaxID=1590 RepID=UPI0009340A05|nr:alpha/beta fold hydrolase [Lactiplantibacillus plantarum]
MLKKISLRRAGLILRGELSLPAKNTYDLVILMHGLGGRSGNSAKSLVWHVAENLQREGLATLKFDFNGHGLSDGLFSEMNLLNELEDAQVALQFALKLGHAKRIYLIGHSQGGIVASMLAGLYPDIVSKLVLLAPAITLRDETLSGDFQGSKFDTKHVPTSLALASGLEVSGFYLRSLRELPIEQVAQNFKGPVRLIHGDSDQAVSKDASLRMHAIYENSQLTIIPGGTHSFDGVARDKVVQIVDDFLSGVQSDTHIH